MIDFEKLNSKTCSNAAYNLLEGAKLAVLYAENYVADNGWMKHDMDSIIDKVDNICSTLWKYDVRSGGGQMIRVSINVNEGCFVVLTEKGANVVNSSRHPDAPQYHQGDIWEGQFHDLLYTFGSEIHKSWNIPLFEKNLVYFESR